MFFFPFLFAYWIKCLSKNDLTQKPLCNFSSISKQPVFPNLLVTLVISSVHFCCSRNENTVSDARGKHLNAMINLNSY